MTDGENKITIKELLEDEERWLYGYQPTKTDNMRLPSSGSNLQPLPEGPKEKNNFGRGAKSMRIDEACINHNSVRLIEEEVGAIYEYCEREGDADGMRIATLGEVRGIILMANALKEVLSISGGAGKGGKDDTAG